MAEESKEQENQQKKEQDKKITPVCSLSVPTIITALHQNALSHCDAASKGMRIINSAINDDKDAELKSAGEHIISAVPLDKDKTIQKKDAIATLKNYVQWFVGPDLANKINDSTVKSLLETPGAKEAESKQTNASSSEAADDEVEDSNDDDLKESFKLTFSQYLLCESNDDSGDEIGDNDDYDDETGEGDDEDDETGAGDDSDDETGEGDDEDDDSGEGSDDDDDSGDGDDDSDDNSGEGKTNEKVESPIGYYIAYNLKVDGLKSTALKDAMKKFAATLFDDLTIKADGLFGGGQSFTIGDVKKAIKGLFGGVDPDDLKSNVEATLKKKYHENISVDILSKEKLLRTYKENLDVKQKSAIDSANYSCTLEIPAEVKNEINIRIIADTVTSSIKGLFKKFKHKISKDDIILIPNVVDDRNNSNDKKIQDLFIQPNELKSNIRKTSTYKKAWDIISSMFEKIKNHKDYKKSKDIAAMYDTYIKILNKDPDANNDDETVKLTSDDIENHFTQFFTEYTEFYSKHIDKNKDSNNKNLSETDQLINNIILENIRTRFLSNIDRIKQSNAIKNDIINILFGNQNSLVEDEDSDLDDNDNSKGDLYIIPMKGLKYDKDKD